MQTQEQQEETSSDEWQALPHVSPSGLALIANLPKVADRPVDLSESRWQHAKHVDFLDNLLVELMAGKLAEQGYVGLVIEEPPRHGKSELCSHYTPAYYLGANPDNRVILCSYESDFATSWGRKVRDTLEEFGPSIYGIQVNPRSAAANRWDILGKRGGMITAGVGGAITGRGGNFLIVDDPVKDMATAQSQVYRQKHWEWYKSTFRSRLEPGGIILLIGTRWHEDDLIGRVLKEMGEDPEADRFMRVRLPALAEAPDEDFPDPDPLGRKVGEALWPERWGAERFRPLQVNAQVWAALYQQRPAPAEGGLFLESWFDVVPWPPGRMKKVVRFWDTAATDPKAGEDPDWTVGLKMGLHESGIYYVLGVERFRKGQGFENELRKVTREDGNIRFRMEQEPGSQGKHYIRTLANSVFRGRAFRGIKSTGNKMLRAEKVAAAAERGEVKVIRGAWNRTFLSEVRHFPYGTHDDQVDALSGAYSTLSGVGSSGMVTW